MSRFDYVAYDDKAIHLQKAFKDHFSLLEEMTEKYLPNGRAKSLVLTKYEEAYMWIGKAVRDDQIKRNGSAELQEGRENS